MNSVKFSKCIPENTFIEAQVKQNEVLKVFNNSNTCKILCVAYEWHNDKPTLKIKPLCNFISYMSKILLLNNSHKTTPVVNKFSEVTSNQNNQIKSLLSPSSNKSQSKSSIIAITNQIINSTPSLVKNENDNSLKTASLNLTNNEKTEINNETTKKSQGGNNEITVKKVEEENPKIEHQDEKQGQNQQEKQQSTQHQESGKKQQQSTPQQQQQSTPKQQQQPEVQTNQVHIEQNEQQKSKVQDPQQSQDSQQQQDHKMPDDIDDSQAEDINGFRNNKDLNPYNDDDGVDEEQEANNLNDKDSDKIETIENNLNSNPLLSSSSSSSLFYGNNYQNNKISTDPFYEESGSNFFIYFLIMMFICMISYVLYHNKTKILALVIEGRRSQTKGKTRRKHTAGYRKLDTNLEEAITSTSSGQVTQIIY